MAGRLGYNISRIDCAKVVNGEFLEGIHELPLHETEEANYRMCRRKMLLARIIGWFKMNTANEINLIENSTGNPVWQRNYFEHIIGNPEAYSKMAVYIQNNPIEMGRKKLPGLMSDISRGLAGS